MVADAASHWRQRGLDPAPLGIVACSSGSSYSAVPGAADQLSWRAPWRRPAVAASLLLAGSLLLAWAASLAFGARWEHLRTNVASALELDACEHIQDNMDYATEAALSNLDSVTSAAICRSRCEAVPKCGVWTWGKVRDVPGLTDVCFLKALRAGEKAKRRPKVGVVSGTTCRPNADREGHHDPSSRVSTVTTSTSKPTVTAAEPSSEERRDDSHPADCSLNEDDKDYWTKEALYEVEHVNSVQKCRAKCENDMECGAWTWGKAREKAGLTDVCFLKKLGPGEVFKRHTRVGVVSGVPCRHAGDVAKARPTPAPAPAPAPAPVSTTSTWTGRPSHTTTTTIVNPQNYSSLFCFALILPTGYEPALMNMQYSQKTSLYACDQYAVYSNQVIGIAMGLQTMVVNSSLKCKFGGEFKTALNTDIFMAVWTRVIDDGQFQFHDWTVKVDADCVFFPQRLRNSLQRHAEVPNGMYLNNCRFGMHGPIEVFSRYAILAWALGRATCTRHFEKLCSGPCLWGEDMFVDQCLSKVLKVKREDDWTILIEDHCDPPSGWRSCTQPHMVAFHPFKDAAEYQQCMTSALKIGL
mmetsp:Transcript_86748/g.194126  ORF Transcript_86748/g.194126 Transcript_86748/m.194126 type:complete len:582 (+) Transcript_86748:78-1823(+)